MNNPIQFMQMLRNPQAYLSQMASYNPMAKNLSDMMAKGDKKGIEQMARNLCRERGIDPDVTLSQVQQQFNMVGK